MTSKRFLDLLFYVVLQESPGRTEPPASETTAEGEEGQKESIVKRHAMSNMSLQWLENAMFTIFYMIIYYSDTTIITIITIHCSYR